MKVTNPLTKTNVAEICDGVFRISTPVPPNPALPAGFTFNQYLVVDDEAAALPHGTTQALSRGTRGDRVRDSRVQPAIPGALSLRGR